MPDLPSDSPTLHKSDGTDFAGTCYVRNLVPEEPYDRNFPEIVVFGDNRRGFSQIGDEQPYFDSFTVECWGAACLTGVKNAIAREATLGLFILKVPDLESATIDSYLVRYLPSEPGEPRFERLYPRRRGFTPIFAAEFAEVEVLGHTSA